MSGGSYDYLYSKDLHDLLRSGMTELDSMIDRLSGLGYARDAAREAAELRLIIRQAETRVEAAMERLSGVFRAVEWWDSMDSREDGVVEALAKYRGAPTPTEEERE